MPELATQLQSVMISNMLLQNFMNHVLPWLLYKLALCKDQCCTELQFGHYPPQVRLREPRSCVCRDFQSPVSFSLSIRWYTQVEAEYMKPTYAKLPNCSGVFSDYNDLVIQFGFVTLFGTNVIGFFCGLLTIV